MPKNQTTKARHKTQDTNFNSCTTNWEQNHEYPETGTTRRGHDDELLRLRNRFIVDFDCDTTTGPRHPSEAVELTAQVGYQNLCVVDWFAFQVCLRRRSEVDSVKCHCCHLRLCFNTRLPSKKQELKALKSVRWKCGFCLGRGFVFQNLFKWNISWNYVITPSETPYFFWQKKDYKMVMNHERTAFVEEACNMPLQVLRTKILAVEEISKVYKIDISEVSIFWKER